MVQAVASVTVNRRYITNIEEFEAFVAESRQLAQQRMQETQNRLGLGTFKHYEIDLPTASIRFLEEGKAVRIRADIQVAGTWSEGSASWMWPWDNLSLPPDTYSHVQRVREFGSAEGLPFLQAPIQPCDEGMAWSMAAIAAKLVDADSLYRAPGAKSDLFLLLFNIHLNQ